MADDTLERDLVRHAAALRGMARALVGPDDADDLVQDAAVRALRRPPRQTAALAGFLATTLRRLASRRRRDAGRRQQREQDAAQPEAIAGADHEVARHEIVERLTRALVSLPDPYRDALLQRFFEDRWPGEIAARSGVPVETVKTRIKRGLALLRARLDRGGSGADWRLSLASALGLGRRSAAAGAVALATKGLIMGTTTKLALGAAVAAAGLAATWLLTQPMAPPPEPAPEAHVEASASKTADLRNDAEPSVASSSSRSTVPAPTDETHDEQQTNQASVSARDDASTEGARNRGVYGIPPPDDRARSVVAQIRQRKLPIPDPALQPDVRAWKDLVDRWYELSNRESPINIARSSRATDVAFKLLAAGHYTSRYWQDDYEVPAAGEEETRPWMKIEQRPDESLVVQYSADPATGRNVVRVVRLGPGSDAELDELQGELTRVHDEMASLVDLAFAPYQRQTR